MRVAIVGGGSSAHLLAVLLSECGHRVRILTSRPEKWRRQLRLRTSDGCLTGEVDLYSTNPDDVIAQAQVAFLCMPVHQYVNALRAIMGAIVRSDCIVGAMYGQGGFDWMVRMVAREKKCLVPRHFAIGLLPWITRTVEYGREAVYYGSNALNAIATSRTEDFEFLQSNILDDLGFRQWGLGRFERVPNFITLTLTVDNQIIHPARCHALMASVAGWRDKADVPLFYRDWDDASSALLSGVDEDYSRVRAKLFDAHPSLRSPYDLPWLALQEWAYQEQITDIKSFFVDAESLRQIQTPVALGEDGLYHLDMNHRFFKDDFAFGIEICEWLANTLRCEVPHIVRLMQWYRQEIKPAQKGNLGPGTPSAYGLDLKDLFV